MTKNSEFIQRRLIVCCLVFGLTSYASTAFSQDVNNHEDHSQQSVAEPAADEIQVNTEVTGNQQNMGHENMTTDMDMGQASQVANGRSPHAYANGYTRQQGLYTLPASEQLSLADEQNFTRLIVNRLEYIDKEDNGASRYDIQAWFGKTYNRFVVKAEGEIAANSLEDSRSELLWSRAVSAFWDTQLGLRLDNGEGPARSWLAVGVQGLAPYWFDVHATAFVGENGRTSIGFEAEYEGRLTQRLTLKPRVDVNFYGKADKERGIGSGFSDATLGLRMQYQFTRQFVPYIGVESKQRFGETADLLRAGIDSRDTRWVAGLRLWF